MNSFLPVTGFTAQAAARKRAAAVAAAPRVLEIELGFIFHLPRTPP
jgi:hypothetical protein